MIAIDKNRLLKFQNILMDRYQILNDELRREPLLHNKDCITKRNAHWVDHTALLKIDKDKVNLAISDLKAILAEISKLK